MDGQGRTNRSLWGIFQSNGSTEKGHHAITGHLIDCSFKVMDLVNQNLIDLIHNGISFFRSQLLHQRREVFHIGKQDGDLFPFAFDLSPLGKNLFRQAARKVFLDLLKLLVKGEFLGDWFGGDA